MKPLLVHLCMTALVSVSPVAAFAQNPVSAIGPELAEIRKHTAAYHDPANAEADGYMPFPVAGVPGAVDFVYGSYALFLDGELRLDQPEVLGYVKLPNGKPRLASVRYLLPLSASAEPPVLLGQEMEPDFGLGAWDLEVWVWVNNPAGLFEHLNPRFLVDWDERH